MAPGFYCLSFVIASFVSQATLHELARVCASLENEDNQ